MATLAESSCATDSAVTTTRIDVEVRNGRHQVRTVAGQLRAMRLHSPADRARVALVGQTALLLGGDEVDLEITVGPGASLELSDIAGTVAYHGRGRPAAWHVRIRLGDGARLRYAGEPFVVSDGADVTRTLTVDLADGASARLRETVVFGRVGEIGGRLATTTVLRRSGVEFCREELLLDPIGRSRPGVLRDVRVVDSVLALGGTTLLRANSEQQREGGLAPRTGPNGCQTSFSIGSDVATYRLLDEGSTLTRFLGSSLADSPLSA